MQTAADKFQSNNSLLQSQLLLAKGNTRSFSQLLTKFDWNEIGGMESVQCGVPGRFLSLKHLQESLCVQGSREEDTDE